VIRLSWLLALAAMQTTPSVVTVDQVDTMPRVVRWPGLKGLDSLRRQPGPASVTVQIVVDEAGAPMTGGFLGIRSSRPGPGLFHLAERMVQTAKFTPAKTRGHPVAVLLHLNLDLLKGEYRIFPRPIAETAYLGSMVDEPPKLIGGKPLVYPDSLRLRGVQGDVGLRLIVDEQGHPERESITIIQPADPGLNAAALTFMTTAVFSPGRNKKGPVRCLVVIPVGFHLMRGS